MFSSLYAGLSGLIGFSRGLDVVSNNVANMNTTGFKSSQLQFQDIMYQYRLAGEDSGNRSSLQVGGGVDTSATSLRFNQGEFRDTGNDLDVAIDGNGFFVLRSEDKTYYTRSGQFEIGEDNYLVESVSKNRLAAMTASGSLIDIDLTGLRTSPPQATNEISFTGHVINGSDHTLNDIEIIDALGKTHKISITFVSKGNHVWDVEVEDANSNITTGEIRFRANGTPETNYNTVTFDYGPDDAEITTIVLDFGRPGSFLGATEAASGASASLAVSKKNGYGLGSLIKLGFDDEGFVVLEYSNTDVIKQNRLALAWFDDLQSLQQIGGSLFENEPINKPHLAYSGEQEMGKILPKKVELSNVELTEQFTDMVILQRGYQASSQIISTTNEMMQQLFDMKAGR